MATKKKTIKYPRELSEAEFEVRDLQWAAAINCSCGYRTIYLSDILSLKWLARSAEKNTKSNL